MAGKARGRVMPAPADLLEKNAREVIDGPRSDNCST